MHAPGARGTVETTPLEDSVRKFLFSPAVWTSLFGAIGVIKTTRNGPRDWRLVLNWVITAAGVAIAVGDVMEKSRNAEDY
jgi:hypothetical protein